MSESPISIFSRHFDPENEHHLLADANAVLPPLPPLARRLLFCTARRGAEDVEVWVSWEAQCAIARSPDITTDEFMATHAADLDQQLALHVASKPTPKNNVWTFDACNV